MSGERPMTADRARLWQAMTRTLGPEAVLLDPAQRAAFALGGAAPALVLAPASATAIGAVVALANEAGQPIVPWGAGTKQPIGDYTVHDPVVVSLSRLNRLLDIDAGNQTAHLEAGVPLRALDAALRQHRLWLPLDPDDWDDATVGGTIAANASGPRRLRYGTVRDSLLGIALVMPTGELVRAGGKTMKDVAGYDLKKLAIGAWGTTGIIVEATLRLLPRPEASAALRFHFPDIKGAVHFGAALLDSQLLPSALEAIIGVKDQEIADSIAGGKATGVLVIAGVEGTASDVAFQRAAIADLARRTGGTALAEAPAEQVWAARRRLRRTLGLQWPAAVWLKASLPLSAIEATLSAAQALHHQGRPLAALAHLGNGIVYLGTPPPAGGADDALVEALTPLAALVAQAGGHLVVERGPRALRERAAELTKRDDRRLMCALKAAIDPANVLNPERLSWMGL